MADKIKKSFGFIGIASLCSLTLVILLNDLIKLVNLLRMLLEQLIDEKRKEKKREIKRRLEKEREQQESIQLEMDRAYSLELEERLDKFHIALIKAVASSKSNLKKNKINK